MQSALKRRSNLPDDHPSLPPSRIAVLLVNLGTPNKPTYPALWRYLRQFLSDRRVIELSPWLWQPILHLFILTRRPRRVAKAYARIWNKKDDESPLRTITRNTARRLGSRFKGKNIAVDWAMRYGEPSIGDAVRRLVADGGATKLLLVPLYPQYSATTTATVNDEAFKALRGLRHQPSLRVMPPWYDDPLYIKTLAAQVRNHYRRLKPKPRRLLCSFHGLPRDYLLKGDPYHCHCVKTARLLREELGWGEDELSHSFQSRFGKGEWLQPYTAELLETLPGDGIKELAVITPGFVADCLETLEEIAIEGRASFLANGGHRLTTIACLNADKAAIGLLETLVKRQLSGW